ncbi:MAG: MAPEG family protein [Betaproteobacteria bacterium]
MTFVLLRIVYGWAYITDRPTLRSLVWIAALACVVALFVVAARA